MNLFKQYKTKKNKRLSAWKILYLYKQLETSLISQTLVSGIEWIFKTHQQRKGMCVVRGDPILNYINVSE